MTSLQSVLPKGFRASTYTPGEQSPRTSTPLPVGIYNVEITNAEMRPLKSGRGTALMLEFTVIEPAQHAGRKVWENLNVQHDSPKAQEIALQQFQSLCTVLEMESPELDDLFRSTLRIKTKIVPEQDGYAANAAVAGYLSALPATHSAKPAAAKPAPSKLADMPGDIPY